MNLSLDTFGHDDEIGRLFEEYDRLVRWEEHNSRLDATDPVVERAVVRGRIVAFIANTATLQQDAHTSIAEPEPQDVEEARDWMGEAKETVEFWREYVAVLEGERTRWAEREKELVEALSKAAVVVDYGCNICGNGEPDAYCGVCGYGFGGRDYMTANDHADDCIMRALREERPA